MSTVWQNQYRRLTSSTASSSAKRSSSSENLGKAVTSGFPPQHQMAKKRPALANVTNQRPQGFTANNRNSFSDSSKIVPCTTKIVSIKKGGPASNAHGSFSMTSEPATSFVKPSVVASSKNVFPQRTGTLVAALAPSRMDVSPTQSDGFTVSMDDSMSTCDSLKSPEVEYLDNNEIVNSIEKKTAYKLCISENVETPGIVCKRDILTNMVLGDDIIDVDGNLMDPQSCATIACDIYKHLRASEMKKRPSTDFMERVQKDINANMRAILIDWLVEVAEEYRLVPETLYLTVNYIDRYLSGNVMDRQRLQLLGVACMMIASKYEEICAPQVEEFCYITDNTYFKDEVLEMESAVLNYLKFEMTAPTVKCFLRRFVRAAQGMVVHEAQSLQLECLANYIAELSLLEYSMLCYAPSLIAASTIFLAKYILAPANRPWNSTLRHYTQYQPSDLHDCVMALHNLCCSSYNSSLPAVREKYSQHKYKFAAKKHCPPSIPPEFFQHHCFMTKKTSFDMLSAIELACSLVVVDGIPMMQFANKLKSGPLERGLKLQLIKDIAQECGLEWDRDSKSFEQKLHKIPRPSAPEIHGAITSGEDNNEKEPFYYKSIPSLCQSQSWHQETTSDAPPIDARAKVQKDTRKTDHQDEFGGNPKQKPKSVRRRIPKPRPGIDKVANSQTNGSENKTSKVTSQHDGEVGDRQHLKNLTRRKHDE
ncbi:OLC1v1016345C1 [Oldenlandia corymbosa var. corymbosa]|uniref:OLC1v1016345C1 n=1 Tax=Oldenlandia corymbosa var. corymbosa TaxID=529605 RepID=A0AAV1E7D9_OLDCO|nr:OLC1v1016345C1 [Oldenlandia corymbosa var. corymbosa]